MVSATTCEHGKRIGKAGITSARDLPWSGMFCPDMKCDPVFFITSYKGDKKNQQFIYSDNNEYFLVEIYEGKVTLKVKRDGWSDTWSLPLEQVRGPQ